MEIASGQNGVGFDQFVSRNIGRTAQPVVNRPEIPIAVLQQLLETLDHKITLLEVVDDVAGAHDALKIEGDPVWGAVLKRKNGLGWRREDACSENAQALPSANEPELDRVPVEAGKVVKLAALQRAPPGLAIGLHEFCVSRVGEQRHVTEDVVEDIGLLKIIELVLRPNKGARWKASIGKVAEKGAVGDRPCNGDDAPARDGPQAFR